MLTPSWFHSYASNLQAVGYYRNLSHLLVNYFLHISIVIINLKDMYTDNDKTKVE